MATLQQVQVARIAYLNKRKDYENLMREYNAGGKNAGTVRVPKSLQAKSSKPVKKKSGKKSKRSKMKKDKTA